MRFFTPCFFLLLCLASLCRGAPGDLDTSFGTRGKVTTGFADQDHAYGVAVQSDGKIIAVGERQNNGGNVEFAVARYTATGALDTTFNTTGKVTTAIGLSSAARSVVLQSDGKIVVAGFAWNGSNYDFAVARYTSAGALDTTFNTTGTLTTPLGSSDDLGQSVVIQSDGKIVVAGYSWNGSDYDCAVARYTAAGALDTSFNTTGKTTFLISAGNDYSTSVAVQSDGKIVLAGYAVDATGQGLILARLTAAGAADTSFGTSFGRRYVNAGSRDTNGNALMLQADGKLVVAGAVWNGTDWDMVTFRFLTDGSNDTSFGTGGYVQTAFTTGNDLASAIALQSDGNIVVAGQACIVYTGAPTPDTAVVRYTSSGALDTTFNFTGKLTTNIAGTTATDYASAVALQSDGKIIVAGTRCGTDSGGNPDFSLQGFTSTGAVSFTAGTDFGTATFLAASSTMQQDGKTLVVGDLYDGSSASYDTILARYNADGSLDTTFGGKGWQNLGVPSQEDHGRTVAVQPDGKIVIGGDTHDASHYYFTVARLSADGTTYDTSFSSVGVFYVIVDNYVNVDAMTLQTDGKILLTGDDSAFLVMRINATGGLDTTFNSTGYIFTNINTFDYPRSIAQQADGKIVVAGFTYGANGNVFALVRYNTNGTLDTSFNGTGKVTTSFNNDDYIFALAVQPNGKILAAGKTYTGYSGGSFGTTYYETALARYNSDGTLDTSFNGTGKVTTNVFSRVESATSVLVRDSGKILVGGNTNLYGTQDFQLLRFNANGSLDTTFGSNGSVVVGLGTGGDYSYGIGTYGGEVVLTGYATTGNHTDFALTKVQTGDPGSLDTTFGTDGVSIKPIYSGTTLGDGRATAVVIQPDGRMVVAGWLAFATKDFVVARFNTDGTLDPAFGTNGISIVDFAGYDDSAMTVALQGDGKILVAGEVGNSTNQDFGLLRLTTSGVLDTTFNTNGKATLDWNLGGQKNDRITKVLVQADGKIIASGYAYNGTNVATFAIARYTTAGALDSTYGTGGKATLAFGGGDENALTAALDANGMLLVAGTAKVGSQYDCALARFQTNGQIDPNFGPNGKLTLGIGAAYDEISDMLVQPDGKIFGLGTFTNGSAYDFIGLRFNADGSLDPTFDGDGKKSYQVTSANDNAKAVALQSDGRLVLAGFFINASGLSEMEMFRINTDGSLDTSFNGTGSLTLSPGPGDDRLYGVTIDINGNIVAVGQSDNASNQGQFALVRLAGDPLPGVSLGAVTSLTAGTATLNGTVNPRGTTATAQFEYGLTTSYGSTASVTLSPGNGSSAQNVSASLQPLSAGTTYHYRLTATTAFGTSATGDATFTTPLAFAYSSAAVVPVTASSYTATGNTASFSLTFAPTAGTNLTVVNNTGLGFISGRFSNLAQGQIVSLGYNGALYRFVANYYGGTGNDLVLQWADVRLLAWGSNASGELGNNDTASSNVPVSVTTAGLLAGKILIAVAAGNTHTLALCSDGTLAAWGTNSEGELGNNSTTQSNVPVAVTTSGVLSGRTVVAISAGYHHCLALCSDGTVAAWGTNVVGELGNNSTTQSNVPVAVNTSGVLAGKTVVAVAAGADHSLVLCSDGTLAAWGRGFEGQLGNNGTAQSKVPVAVVMSGVLSGKTVIAISAGGYHNLALCSDGTLVSWGDNTAGSLGNNSTTQSNVPVAVNTSGVLAGKAVVAMAAGNHSLALCSDGTLAAWGRNSEGQLGINSTVLSTVPVSVGTSGVLAGRLIVAVSAGINHSMALCSDGTLAAWGWNSTGQLGINSTANSLVPAAVIKTALATSERFGAAQSGSSATHSFALAAAPPNNFTLAATAITATGATLNGTVNAQGSSTAVSFEYGLTTAYGSSAAATPTPVTGSSPTAVSAALTGLNSGTLYHYRVSGTSSAGTTTGGDLTFVTPLSNLSAVYNAATDVPVTAAAVTATGATVNFTLGFAPAPGTELMVVKNTGLDFIKGTFSNLAQGQTVMLAYAGVNYPFVAHYFGGTGNDLVLVWKGQQPWAWGYNGEGELGSNNNANSLVPVPVLQNSVLAGKTVVAAAAGSTHSLALSSDGTLAAWGYNVSGQLGNNSGTSSTVPVAVVQSGVLAGKTVIAIAAGNAHSLALCSDGTLAAWGFNGSGQLGNNSTTNSPVPVAVLQSGVLAGKTVVAIAASSGSLALCSDGTVAAWGYNGYGQLGNNSTIDSSVPVAVNTAGLLAGKTVVAIAGGGYHALALCSDGTLAAWGYNGNGQLGNSSTINSSLPVAVMQSGVLAGKTVSAIAGGSNHSLALCTDGTVVSWGYNGNGQLGNSGTTVSSIPVAMVQNGVLAGKTVSAVAGGNSHSLMLCTDGTLAACGYNGSSQLGNNSTVQSTVPVLVSTSAFAAGQRATRTTTGSGASHSLALMASPVPPAVTTLAATAVSSAGVTLNGSVNAKDNSTAVSFNYGTTTAYGSVATATPTPVTGSSNTAVSATISGLTPGVVYHFRVCGVSAAGTSYGSDLVVATPLPNLTPVYNSAADVAVSAEAVTAAGATLNLGLNFAPRTGTNLTVLNNTGAGFISGQFSNLAQGQTVVLNYNGQNYSFVANYYGGTGNDLVLVWKDTQPWAWGNNANGSLGNNTTTNSSVPVAVLQSGVLAGKTVISMSAASGHSLAVCSDGTLAAWGYNGFGQLGNNSTTSSSVPVAVVQSGVLAGKTVIAVAAGNTHSLALCSDGTLAAWGYNGNGQLGNGNTSRSPVPVAVVQTGVLAGKLATAITAGDSHNLALCSDGTVVGWGYNAYGQLGNNSTIDSSVPVVVVQSGVLAGKTVVDFSAAGIHSLALCSDGTLVAWGYNGYGQLGNNSTTDSPVPVAVAQSGVLAGKTIVAFSAGYMHSLALCADGTLAAWGYNGYGQLGNNSTTNSPVPLAVLQSGVLAGRTVVAVDAGFYHSAAKCSDGTLVAWGYNGYGQLGNNSTTTSSVPVLVSTAPLAAGQLFAGVSVGTTANHCLALVAFPPPPRPAVYTLAATSISLSGAVLNGVVNANGSSSTAVFEYGQSTGYGSTIPAGPSPITGSTDTAVTATLSGLSPGTTYHFRITGTSSAGIASSNDSTFTTTPTAQQSWRQTWFGTTANTGSTADSADYDHDGVPNLIEWACHLNPTTSSALPITTHNVGANVEFTYTRSVEAKNAGAIFTVEWSNTLTGNDWSHSGVTEQILSDDGTTQQVKALIPINAATRKFVHLSVTAPP